MPLPANPACWGVVSAYRYSAKAKAIETALLGFCASAGIDVRVTSRVRTCQQQSDLYAAGKSTAAPSTSQHEFGLAFDLVPIAGLSRYGASKREGIQWLAELAPYFGGAGLPEPDHAHITVYDNASWRRFILSRDVALSLPIPSKKPR